MVAAGNRRRSRVTAGGPLGAVIFLLVTVAAEIREEGPSRFTIASRLRKRREGWQGSPVAAAVRWGGAARGGADQG